MLFFVAHSGESNPVRGARLRKCVENFPATRARRPQASAAAPDAAGGRGLPFVSTLDLMRASTEVDALFCCPCGESNPVRGARLRKRVSVSQRAGKGGPTARSPRRRRQPPANSLRLHLRGIEPDRLISLEAPRRLGSGLGSANLAARQAGDSGQKRHEAVEKIHNSSDEQR